MNISPKDIYIFLGPSLPRSTAKSILKAKYFPPVKQGDILQIVTEYKPKVIGIIDGFFKDSLSVWHKEILYALSQGIAVFGASSMGALRAAELRSHGMIGVGTIFELYDSKEIDADDEVALIHGGEEDGYTPLSIPLINLTITLKQTRGDFSRELCESFLKTAKEIYYPDRTWENLKEKLAPSHDKLFKFAQENYIDQKKRDASVLLHRLNAIQKEDFPQQFEFISTPLFDILNHYNRRIPFSPVELTHREIGQHIALHHPDFQELQFHANNQALTTLLAKLLNVEASEEEIEEEKIRFMQRHQLQKSDEFEKWLKNQNYSEGDFNEVVKERATTRKLQHSYLLDPIPWKKNRALLNELKWQNQYEKWLEKAKDERALLTKALSSHIEIEDDILKQHMQATKWQPDIDIDKWIEEANFESLYELKTQMQKCKIAREQFFKEILSSLSS